MTKYSCESNLTYEDALDLLDQKIVLSKNDTLETCYQSINYDDVTEKSVSQCSNNKESFSEQNIHKSRPLLITSYDDNLGQNNYYKGCKWAPDGSCLLSNREDKILRIFNMPSQLWTKDVSNIDKLKVAVKIKEVDLVFDYCWYPLMNTWNPLTCNIATTCRNSPIHLWNVCSKSVVNTFKSYTQSEELETSYSLAFSSNGLSLYAGLNKSILIYDLQSSFSQYHRIPTHNKNFPGKGQHGIISCFGVSQFHPNLFAAGAYSNSIGIYTTTNNALVSLLHGSQGGITHLIFSSDGTKLFSGGRKDPYITCWDLRNMGKVCKTFDRPVTNNQRIYFDIDNQSKYMASGLMNGDIALWDLEKELAQNDSEQLSFNFPAHNDTVNGVSFHPNLPILASASGKRHVNSQSNASDSSSSDCEENSSREDEDFFNSIKLWWYENV